MCPHFLTRLCVFLDHWQTLGRGSERVLVELPDEDVTALREPKVNGRKGDTPCREA